MKASGRGGELLLLRAWSCSCVSHCVVIFVKPHSPSLVPLWKQGWDKSLYGNSSCWETTPGVRRGELAGGKQGRRAMWCRVQCQAGPVKAAGDNQAGPLWGALSQNGHPRDGSGEPLLISAPEGINSLAFSIAFVWVITAESGMPKSRWETF